MFHIMTNLIIKQHFEWNKSLAQDKIDIWRYSRTLYLIQQGTYLFPGEVNGRAGGGGGGGGGGAV